MRAVIAIALLAVAGCGPARHVVIHPDEVAGRKGDAWHVASEPSKTAEPSGEAPPPR